MRLLTARWRNIASRTEARRILPLVAANAKAVAEMSTLSQAAINTLRMFLRPTALEFCLVQGHMLGSRQQYQVLWPVIGLDVVAMVNMLSRQQGTAQEVSHDHTVLGNIAGLIGVWMLRLPYLPISGAINMAATHPVRRLWSLHRAALRWLTKRSLAVTSAATEDPTKYVGRVPFNRSATVGASISGFHTCMIPPMAR